VKEVLVCCIGRGSVRVLLLLPLTSTSLLGYPPVSFSLLRIQLAPNAAEPLAAAANDDEDGGGGGALITCFCPSLVGESVFCIILVAAAKGWREATASAEPPPTDMLKENGELWWLLLLMVMQLSVLPPGLRSN
jgi:hypothetical protein